MQKHSNWYLMTITMPVCLATCLLLTIAQQRSLNWYSNVIEADIFKKKKELFCLYGVYLMGALCAVQCFLCHISNLFPVWYCVYGMPLCVILYAGTKTFLYGFFLERAKCVQSAAFVLPKVLTKYILPAYIACYFIIYLILCPLAFRGEVIDADRPDNKSIPTACIFGHFYSWVFDFSAAVDIFNSIFFLFLFAYPLCNAVKQKEHFQDSVAHRKLRKGLLKTIKFNIVCSSICSISSVSFLIIMSFAKGNDIGYYLWFGGDIDIMVNSICIFLMVGANRKYALFVWNRMRKKVVKKPQQSKSSKSSKADTKNDEEDEVNGELPNWERNNSMRVAKNPNMSELTTNSVVSSTQNDIDCTIQCDFGHIATPVQCDNSISDIVFEIQCDKAKKDTCTTNDTKTVVVISDD